MQNPMWMRWLLKFCIRAELEYKFCTAGDADPASLADTKGVYRVCANRGILRKLFIKEVVSKVISVPRYPSWNSNCKTDKLCKGKSHEQHENHRDTSIFARWSRTERNTARKLRVAAYCRVSTEEEEQQGSFEIQKLYYTEKINSTPEWEVAGIYADDGISGVHTKKRDGFNQMIQDCKKRKIDLILTKSISRFARNTLDSIQVCPNAETDGNRGGI